MRLLQVIAVMGQGGAERMVLQLTGDAVAHGDAAAVASAASIWSPEVQRAGGVHYPLPIHRHALRALPTPGAVRQLRRVVREFRPDVVHTHNVAMTAATRAALVGLRPAPALLTTLHGLPPEDYPRAGRVLRLSAPQVIACSGAVAASLTAAGYPSDRVRVISNGATLSPADAGRRDEIRRRYGLDGRPLVVALGRLAPQKAWPTLIEAAREIDPQADIVVGGDGPLRSDLERSAAAAGDRVRFLGRVDDVAALLELARCVVSTSTWEGLPLTLLEALSLGVPVVATAVDGVRDAVSERAAVLVAAGDPHAVAAGVNRLLADDALHRRLSAAARELSREWTTEAMLGHYRDAYATAAAASERP